MLSLSDSLWRSIKRQERKKIRSEIGNSELVADTDTYWRRLEEPLRDSREAELVGGVLRPPKAKVQQDGFRIELPRLEEALDAGAGGVGGGRVGGERGDTFTALERLSTPQLHFAYFLLWLLRPVQQTEENASSENTVGSGAEHLSKNAFSYQGIQTNEHEEN